MKKRLLARGRPANFVLDDDGATAIEYGLIAALIAVSLIASVTALSNAVSDSYAVTEQEITNATTE